MIVVADTSVLLNLCFLGKESLLTDLFDLIGAPPEVRQEFERLSVVDPRFKGLRFPEFVAILSPLRTDPRLQSGVRLHAGEVAAISLAVERSADAILLDDRAARRAAVRMGYTVIGVVGILLQGKFRERIDALGPLLDRLETAAKFRIAPTLRAEVLALAGEGDFSANR